MSLGDEQIEVKIGGTVLIPRKIAHASILSIVISLQLLRVTFVFV
jgi:hypothetical protein